MNTTLYVILHTQLQPERYDNIATTWGQGKDLLFYSDHTDTAKNIVLTSLATNHASAEEKFRNVVRYLTADYKYYQKYMFCDNDTFVNTKIIEDMKVNDDQLIGQIIKCWPQDPELGYPSGGAGFLINHATLYKMGKHFGHYETGYSDVSMGVYAKDHGLTLHDSDLFKSQPPGFYGISGTECSKYATFHYITSKESMQNLHNISREVSDE